MSGHIKKLLRNADKALEEDLATAIDIDMEEFAEAARMPVAATLPEKSLKETGAETIKRSLGVLHSRYNQVDAIIGQLTDHLAEVQTLINALTAAQRELKPTNEKKPTKPAELDKLVAQNADAVKKAS